MKFIIKELTDNGCKFIGPWNKDDLKKVMDNIGASPTNGITGTWHTEECKRVFQVYTIDTTYKVQ